MYKLEWNFKKAVMNARKEKVEVIQLPFQSRVKAIGIS